MGSLPHGRSALSRFLTRVAIRQRSLRKSAGSASPLLHEAGFMGQIEGIRLFGLIFQFEDQAEVGEVIGHVLLVSFLLRVAGCGLRLKMPSQRRPGEIWCHWFLQ